jgi:hypothetical protein
MYNKMSENVRNDSGLFPYYIYHYEDPNTQTYLGHISSAEVNVDDKGEISYQGMGKSLIYTGWKKYGKFYSLEPSFQPIPRAMVLLCAKWLAGFPYQTYSIKHVMDPFNKEMGSCVYFYAYDRFVPNTVPLYFYSLNVDANTSDDIIWPSFEKDPPGGLDWKLVRDPVYVLAPDHTSEKCKTCLTSEEILTIGFDNVDNACVPTKDGIYETIKQCIVSTGGDKSETLLEMIAGDKKKDKDITFRKFFKQIPDYAVSIILGVFAMSFVIVFLILLNGNK